NPVRDYVYGSQPLVVGTQGGGIANFSPTLAIPFNNTSGSLIAPTFVNNYQPNGGATFGIAFLSDLEVYLFLTAAQGDTRSNVLSAPKITTFNGASATLVSGTQQFYVASISPIIGPGAVAYMPQVNAINSGVTLTVTPVVSADRRYVRLTMLPNFTTINGFTTYAAQTGAVGGSGLGGGAATITGQIQLPNLTSNFITTTVTVPDGGTVLMGGVKSMTEQRIEYGVPVLSKTPLIDRLFRNVGIGRNSQSLMIMVSPHIIILEEEEERLGIPSVAL
ncbi:MAG: type II secretion system protein GspD, partial [Isosphaeraceae bacterium]